ncbi:hypothetical protein [Roseateles paludis]|jgi:hypothetical protein|uniref:Phosphohydrolase n=1 Tax=Roseateles paludis TaxID=3145238 RepID=A0ABV0FW98_9BURK
MSPLDASTSDSLARTLREASQQLLDWQRAALQEPQPPAADPLAAAAALQAFFHRLGPATATERERAGWSHCIQVLLASSALPPQRPLQAGCLGSCAHDLAALLRPPTLALDEAEELDLAVRYWEQARKAGWLDEDLDADFGEFWRRVDWCALAQHLSLLGAGPHPDEARLAAYIAKTASRYAQLSPLKRLTEQVWPQLFDLSFTLR